MAAQQDPWMMAHERQVVRFVQSAGIAVRVTSRVRTFEQQERLYCERRGTRYPAALPHTSQHTWGFAYDIVPDAGQLRTKYGASLAEGLAWLAQIATRFDAVGIAEGDHTHVQAYPADVFLAALNEAGDFEPNTGSWIPVQYRQPYCAPPARSGGGGGGATWPAAPPETPYAPPSWYGGGAPVINVPIQPTMPLEQYHPETGEPIQVWLQRVCAPGGSLAGSALCRTVRR